MPGMLLMENIVTYATHCLKVPLLRKLWHAEDGHEDGQVVEDLANLGDKELCLRNMVDRVDVTVGQ
jgi:hypothetical protein